MKKGIRYLRYSKDGQSNSSIERQDIYTRSWFDRSDVQIIDTFIDEGYSARTFDRPDFKKLQEFISKNHKQVDYLVVDQMDRFSRDAGEALTMIKRLQMRYAIQIVSANDGLIYDHNTPGSLLRTGLQFLLAEENNIDRTQKIRAGIYTAKAKEGRYIGSKPPFGYTKDGYGKNRHLVINPEQASVIRYIFNSFLNDTPLHIIFRDVKQMGFRKNGNSLMTKILTNPVYAGYQLVAPHKHLPGGLFPAQHEAIIDMPTWQRVQDKIKGGKPKTILNEKFPLRGVLRCHCSTPVTGAPSRSKSGRWYDYYKCHKPGHNNFSATKAHNQLQEILHLLSIPHYLVEAIATYAREEMEATIKENRILAATKHRELDQAEQQLLSLEEKWINNQVTHETYQRWYTDITNKRITLRSNIEALTRDEQQTWELLFANLEKLADLKWIYNQASLPEKQALIKKVFDNRLYYQSHTYRTPYLIAPLTHNALMLKEKGLLIIDGWDYTKGENPLRWSPGDANRTLPDLLAFLTTLRVA